MKDYKLLLAGLILLLLVIFIAIFTWLWTSNRKNMDPLPIMSNESGSSTAEEDENSITKSSLHIQAEEKLQEPLDDVIASFQSRYPNVEILTNYVASTALLTLSDSKLIDNERSSFIVDIDMIIATNNLSAERLAPLQEKLKIAQDEYNQTKINNSTAQNSTVNDTPNADNSTDDEAVTTEGQNDNTNTRNLVSFSYALKNKQAADGVILTQNPVAINFRNFLLSSTGQDILSKYDYENIDGYKNEMSDLFQSNSQGKQATGEHSVDVAEALSNGK